MNKAKGIIILSLLTSCFFSCKKEEEKKGFTIEVEGKVLHKKTKIPLKNVPVILWMTVETGMSTSASSKILFLYTDSSGKFSVFHKEDNNDYINAHWKLQINYGWVPGYWDTISPIITYIKEFAPRIIYLKPDDRLHNQEILLSRIGNLIIKALSSNPVSEEKFYIMGPGIGCHCANLNINNLEGNIFYGVYWSYNRDGIDYKGKDSVFCMEDSVTTYIINY